VDVLTRLTDRCAASERLLLGSALKCANGKDGRARLLPRPYFVILPLVDEVPETLAEVLLKGLLPELLKGLLENELLNGLLLKDEPPKKNVPEELPLELHQLLPLLKGLELHQLLLLPLKGVELKELLLPENDVLMPDDDELPDVEDADAAMRVILFAPQHRIATSSDHATSFDIEAMRATLNLRLSRMPWNEVSPLAFCPQLEGESNGQYDR
jgi:hypothetical protein